MLPAQNLGYTKVVCVGGVLWSLQKHEFDVDQPGESSRDLRAGLKRVRADEWFSQDLPVFSLQSPGRQRCGMCLDSGHFHLMGSQRRAGGLGRNTGRAPISRA